MSCQTNKPLRNSPALRAELLRRVDNDQSVESTTFRQLIPADSTIDQELQSLPHTDNKQWWKRFRRQSAAYIRRTIAKIEAAHSGICKFSATSKIGIKQSCGLSFVQH